ncbi:DNA-processing protein DprA [Clostridium baratii]|uniref:DNA-processing protein DprA n=1 Tax=Clostridium baratii TaxID=1561 RepID=UPI0006BB1B75|nr:DNA-processing protein DprA [Clostridium baratii]
MNNKYYIALQLMGINNNIIIEIMKCFNKNELKKLFEGDILELSFKYNIRIDKYIEKFNDKLYINKIIKRSEDVIRKNKELKIKTILYTSKQYPDRLKIIKDPPAIIYLKGRNILKHDLKSVACIGTRTPTTFGVNAIKSIVKNLVNEQFTIISGLAEGVDELVHKICLENNGRTIAVLAHGLDIIYPKKNEGLANHILEKGGTLLSEFPVGTKIEKFMFVNRNRIVSALSKGVVMIEAKQKSGTRHTVNFAIEQNKPIFCPVFTSFSIYSGLNLELIKEKKATTINGNDDYVKIISELGYKIKYDKKAICKIKKNSMNELLNNKIIFEEKDLLNEIDLDKFATFKTEKDKYLKFKSILKDKDLTLKEFFNLIIDKVISENSKER